MANSCRSRLLYSIQFLLTSDFQSLYNLIIRTLLIRRIPDYLRLSAPGSDGIPPRFVELAKTILTPFLTKIFNECIQHEIFPNAFKTAQVISIPKILSPKSLNDLRSIFLFVFSKLFEKILEFRMLRFLNKNNILTSSQFGFRTNSFTELAITIIKQLKCKKNIFFDVS